MCHRLKWFIHLRDQGLSKGDEHPTTNTPHGVWYSLPYLCNSSQLVRHVPVFTKLLVSVKGGNAVTRGQ